MREKTIIPTTLLDWPRVSGLLPEEKLIYGLGLWGGRYTNSIGVAQVPIKPLAASLGFDPVALEKGLENLHGIGLIAFDVETGEVFVRDWFRFHLFGGVGKKIAGMELGRVTSPKLRALIVKAVPWIANMNNSSGKQTVESPTVTVTATANPTKNAAAFPVGLPRGFDVVCGIRCYRTEPADRQIVEKLAEQYGEDAVTVMAEKIAREEGELPLPSQIARLLSEARKKTSKSEAMEILLTLVGKKFITTQGALGEVVLEAGKPFWRGADGRLMPLHGDPERFARDLESGVLRQIDDD